MSYFLSTILHTSFDDTVIRVAEELQNEGFGILSDIDVKSAFQKKLNVEFRKYRILGACNPQFAYKALETEDKVGTMMPCNVVVQDLPGVGVEVAAVDPVASLQAIKNPALEGIAVQVREKLKNVIDKLSKSAVKAA